MSCRDQPLKKVIGLCFMKLIMHNKLKRKYFYTVTFTK